VIEEIDQIMFAIASSVEQQTSVTNDISSNLSTTAENAKDLNLNAAENIDAVKQVAINLEATSRESDLIRRDVTITTHGIEGVSNYVGQTHDSVKSSAQGIQEIQRQADELASLARDLNRSIQIFKI
jgi:methyl-accepting chemotaxis protein